jgi:type II secretory pathway component PulF
MRYLIAIAVSVVLTVFMFVFMHWMLACAREWQAQNAELPAITEMAVNAAFFIRNYWPLPVALFVAVPLVIAALWPRRTIPR